MKITIHQPEHFPYMGFFQKMAAADLFVILDDVQYTKGNFQNRNKFLNKNGVEEWFNVELEQGANKKLIKDVQVNDGTKWRSKIVSKIQTNFKIDISHVYDSTKLVDINMASIDFCRAKLGISTPMVFSSQLNLQTTQSQRLADICKYFKATEYLSGEGGRSYLDESLFHCSVTYFHPTVSDYYTTLQHI
mgnify:CR=1 FL=1